MNKMTTALCAISVLVSAAAAMADVPVASDAKMSQDPLTRTVTVRYRLSADAVVTIDIQTNAAANAAVDADGWVSIGGENIQGFTGAAFRKVLASEADGEGYLAATWHPDLSWPGQKITGNRARAVVTAWALDNTPDYMVVDISAAAQPGDVAYYPGVEWLPGGILGNTDYRENKIVMRKIMAKNVKWTMGSVGENGRESAKEGTHTVQLTNNYYIGVFEVTQTQWALVQTAKPYPSNYNNADFRAMRPVEKVSYNEIRCAANSTTAAGGAWPAAPYEGSFLDLLRDKTGIDFDLPSEAQWEFACRAGNGEGLWGNGAPIAESTLPGRYLGNAGNTISPPASSSTNLATMICGSYAPNSWGLYDMHGNVWEWCLDWYTADISSLNGAVNMDSSENRKVRRGGAWINAYTFARSACRYYDGPATAGIAVGFRLACQAGLK